MSLLDDLPPKQRRYVELYTGPGRGNATQCAKDAGYRPGASIELMKNEKILNAIMEQNDLQRKQMFYVEQDILEALWTEAQKEGKGTSQNGRIQALVYLGKHIGMWDDKSKALKEAQEKRDQGGITYNIINFSDEKKTELENKVIEAVEDNRADVEKSISLPGVIIENYGSDEET